MFFRYDLYLYRIMKNIPSRHTAVALTVKPEEMRCPLLITALAVLFSLLGIMIAEAKRPVKVSAADLVGKVYCVADPALGRESCLKQVENNFSGTPVSEDGAEWMSESEGFIINYHGQSPEAEAMARYDHDTVAGYGYIFYFPYKSTQRERANKEQCRFCSELLDDLCALGAMMGADPLTENLFDVSGVLKGGDVQLTLTEDVDPGVQDTELQAGAENPNQSGRFILVMSVVPASALQYTAQQLAE